MYFQAQNPAPISSIQGGEYKAKRYYPLFWPAECWKCSSRWIWSWGWKTPKVSDLDRYDWTGCLCTRCAPTFKDAELLNQWHL